MYKYTTFVDKQDLKLLRRMLYNLTEDTVIYDGMSDAEVYRRCQQITRTDGLQNILAAMQKLNQQ